MSRKWNNMAEASTIFIYLLTGVIAVMILIFGYKVITGISGSSDKITILNFHTEFERDIDLDSTWGTVKLHQYKVPGRYEEICLIDIYDGEPPADFCRQYPIVCDSWQAKALKNVFLLPDGEPFMVANMTFGQMPGDCEDRDAFTPSLCMPVEQGWLEVRTRGWGDVTCVEKI